MHQRDPEVWFVIVGDGYRGETHSAYHQQLTQLIRGEGLEGRVVLTGYQNGAIHLMKSFDVLVLPSKREAFGGVLIEAMALGVPVVASAVDGIPEVVEHGVSGLLVQEPDPQRYASAILHLLHDTAFANQIRAAASERVKRFDSARVIQQLEACYEQVLSGNGASPSSIAMTTSVPQWT